MHLVFAILHVYEAAILAVEQLGIALATPAVTGLFEHKVLFAIARKHTDVALALDRESIILHHGLEINTEVYVLFHKDIIFEYTKKDQESENLRILKAPEELLDERTDALRLTGGERMEVTYLNNLFLELTENRLIESVKPVALQIVKE